MGESWSQIQVEVLVALKPRSEVQSSPRRFASSTLLLDKIKSSDKLTTQLFDCQLNVIVEATMDSKIRYSSLKY